MRSLTTCAAVVAAFCVLPACEEEVRDFPEDRVMVPGLDDPMAGADEEAIAAMDPDLVRALAEERLEAGQRMRRQVALMREVGSEGWAERREGHVRRVDGFIAMLREQTGRIQDRLGHDDPGVGAVMGVPGSEHHALISETQAVRQDLEQLRDAPGWRVMQVMPGHLDRLDALALTVERSGRRLAGDQGAGEGG